MGSVNRPSSRDFGVIGYTRVSTAEQVAEGMSLQAQESRIRAWCEAQDAQLIEIVRDEGVSGTKLLADRTGGRKIAEASRFPSPKCRRRGRRPHGPPRARCRRADCPLETISYGQGGPRCSSPSKSTSPLRTVSAMAQIGAVFNELERALIAERTTEALTELRHQGRAWNHAPFGWDVVEGRLEPNPAEQETVAMIRDSRRSGLGYLKIAQGLNGEGRSTKRGGPWQAAKCRSVLLSAGKMAAA